MAQSLNLATAATFESYVRRFYPDLLRHAHFGFESGMLMTPIEGVKGREIITQMTVAALSKRYNTGAFTATANAFNFIPRVLEVCNASVDLRVRPKDFEGTYLGKDRQKGQNDKDLPYEGQILEEFLAKVAEEKEDAIWKAAKTSTPTNADPLMLLFDGFREIIKDEITLGNLAVTATGAITNTNAVAAVENVYKSIGKAYKQKGVDIFLGFDVYEKFVENYRENYSKNFEHSDGIVRLPYNRRAIVHVLPGVPDNCILVTPKENLYYGYDGAMDDKMIKFENEDRDIKMWMDYNIGVNFGIVNDDIIAINNQWTV